MEPTLRLEATAASRATVPHSTAHNEHAHTVGDARSARVLVQKWKCSNPGMQDPQIQCRPDSVQKARGMKKGPGDRTGTTAKQD